MITIKEIGKLAGVSRGTVDRVLNNRPGVNPETYRRVKEIAEEYGYEPGIQGQMLAARKKKLKIGFIVCDSPVDLFFHDVLQSARKKAEELKAYGVRVEIYPIKMLSENYLNDFLKRVEEDELDGIALIPLQMKAMVSFIKRMEEKEVPLVFYNLDMENVGRLSYVGCNYYNAGKVAAGLIALTIQGKGKVAIATSFHKETLSFQNRLDGFLDELNTNYPDIEVVNREENYIFQKDDYSCILNIIRNNKDIKAIYIVNPGDYSLCDEIAQLDRNHSIKIITNDLLKERAGLLEQGIISAVIGQQPEIQGFMPLQILYEYLTLGVVPEKKYITDLSIHIKQSVPK